MPTRTPMKNFYTFINPAMKQANSVMPDLIRHPVPAWIPAFGYLVAGVIKTVLAGNAKCE